MPAIQLTQGRSSLQNATRIPNTPRPVRPRLIRCALLPLTPAPTLALKHVEAHAQRVPSTALPGRTSQRFVQQSGKQGWGATPNSGRR